MEQQRAANELQPGMIVSGSYKTGIYLGELLELRGSKALVRVQAVVRHPEQGDLHQGRTGEVAFFHERRALAERETSLMPLHDIRPYAGPVPPYKDSLRAALARQREELVQLAGWANRSLDVLQELERDYRLGDTE